MGDGISGMEVVFDSLICFGRFDCLISIWGGFYGSVKFEPAEQNLKIEQKNHTTNNDFSTQMDSS